MLVTGLYDPKQEGARFEALWGALYGSGPSGRFGSGFVEADWLDGRGGVVFARWNTDTLGRREPSKRGATVGLAAPFSRLVRLDLDMPVSRRATAEPQFSARLRLFY